MARNPVQHKGYFRSGRIEHDVLGCSHCTASIIVPPGQMAAVHRCMGCMRAVCERCYGELAVTMRCQPFEERFEAVERRRRM